MCKLNNRTGEILKNNQGCAFTIIEYSNAQNCTIKFEDGYIVRNRGYSSLKKGAVTNPFFPFINGVGYIGIGKYSIIENFLAYTSWKNMLQRCYNKQFISKHPTYVDCSVDERWHCFQDFAEWHEENWKDYMEGWSLDKDVLVKWNKIYSPETCCFIPHEINTQLRKKTLNSDSLPIGVSRNKKGFHAKCYINGIRKGLGTYKTPEEAFQAYKTAKESYIKEVAEKWKSQITEKVYNVLINYKIEITD